EGLAMTAALEQVALNAVALRAQVADRRDAWRCRAMIAVAVVARRCREVAFCRQLAPVHAALVLRELIYRDVIPRHVRPVAVTPPAGVDHLQWMDGRPWVRHGPNRMRRVAARARGDLLIV